MRRCCLLAAVLLLAICPGSCRRAAPPADSKTAEKETAGPVLFRGLYEHGFEISRFTPCGSSEQWWLSGDLDQLSGSQPSAMNILYIEVRGDLSAKGQWGHLGAYERQLEVRQVVQVRPGPTAPSDCR